MSDGGSRGRGQLYLYVTVVAVYLFWGGNFVFSKVALKEMPGALVAGMRFRVWWLLTCPRVRPLLLVVWGCRSRLVTTWKRRR